MAGITQAQAEARLALYLSAEEAVLGSQAYSIGGRSLTRADLLEIREGIKFWNGQVQRFDRGGISIRGATPTE